MAALLGLMQDRPLLISSLIDYAATYHGDVEIVSRAAEGGTDRSSWRAVHSGAKRVAKALSALGIEPGDRVATLAWNGRRHLELYFGVSGAGAVLHTVNPRLFVEQIEYIVNHAEDRVLCFDAVFAPLVQQLAPRLKTVQHYVALTDAAHRPALDVPSLHVYDDWTAAQDDCYRWPVFDERTASSLCYTSGTTGHPKGVLYSHRSTLLHTLAAISPDTTDLTPQDSILLIVPMFHANAWGTPYAAAMVGCKLVLPGQHLDGASVWALLKDEKVTLTQGVPTVWLMLFQHLDAHPELDPKALKLKRVGIGGSAVPRSMIERFERDFGTRATQGWGMTETSPLGVASRFMAKHAALGDEERMQVKLKQGRGVWGVEMKLVDDAGAVLPWDGRTRGHLLVRGPWIAAGYFKREGGDVLDDEGYLRTGDVATIDADGYLQLVDRAKDVIKSGGEWISSIDVENAAVGHPAIAEAAIIGVPHPKWQERPLLVAVKRPGHEVTKEALLDWLRTRLAKWWLPDDVIFVPELPHTATGKLLKTKLREQYRDHLLSDT